jgi:hypothetical protein
MHALDRDAIVEVFRRAGAVRLFVKRLAPNDNSKNQVYLGGSYALLNQFPFEAPEAIPSAKGRAVIHARFPLSWLRAEGGTEPARHTKLILYPQYPEVRLSGFLRGCATAPNDLLTNREAGRLLFLGVTADRRVLGCAVAADSVVARQFESIGMFGDASLLVPITWTDEAERRDRLLAALLDVSNRGWIESMRLDSTGDLVPCRARNCGGYTLEACLGVRPNSRSEPDFEGYEIKQFGVADFTRFRAKSPITLFTPEPTIGYYADAGVRAFLERFGYADTRGRRDRRNFGGRFVHGKRLEKTGLTLSLRGADSATGRILDAAGAIELVNDEGVVAAGWPFASLLGHWNRKHAEVAYVPSMKKATGTHYRFASTVFLGYGTDFGRLMRAIATGAAYYDPGIKLEGVSGPALREQRRSQFRTGFRDLDQCYARFEAVLLAMS